MLKQAHVGKNIAARPFRDAVRIALRAEQSTAPKKAEELAREAMRLAAMKLPVKTRFVTRDTF